MILRADSHLEYMLEPPGELLSNILTLSQLLKSQSGVGDSYYKHLEVPPDDFNVYPGLKSTAFKGCIFQVLQ